MVVIVICYRLVAVSTFTLVCNCHHHLPIELFCYLRLKVCTWNSIPSSPVPFSHHSASGVCEFDYCTSSFFLIPVYRYMYIIIYLTSRIFFFANKHCMMSIIEYTSLCNIYLVFLQDKKTKILDSNFVLNCQIAFKIGFI